jgi:SAM-dependent methyltransferase
MAFSDGALGIVAGSESFRCNLCSREQAASQIANLGALPFWYGVKSSQAEDFLAGRRFSSRLVQCGGCGFVQQLASPEIAEILPFFYATTGLNNISAAAGQAGWGAEIVKEFRRMLSGIEPRTVLELGCGNGHLIDEWKGRGVDIAVGFDPAAPATCTPNGALLVQDYFSVDRARALSPNFDLIYSFGVLEHVASAASLVQSAVEVLTPGGAFIAEVPNGEAGLLDGDIGMFVHEHLNYFTPETLSRLCATAGLRVEKIIHNASEIIILARKTGGTPSLPEAAPVMLKQYVAKCRERQERIAGALAADARRFAMYGACLGLCNINALLPEALRDGFDVIDSDAAKWGKQVAGVGVVVQGPDKFRFESCSDVMIIPYAFQSPILRYLEGRHIPTRIWRAYDDTVYAGGEWVAA